MDAIMICNVAVCADTIRPPWRRSNIPLSPPKDPQDRINYCLEECPYADGECVNCLSGGTQAAQGRPVIVDRAGLEAAVRHHMSNREICQQLHISMTTLKRHKRGLAR